MSGRTIFGVLAVACGVLSVFGNMMATAHGDSGKSRYIIMSSGLALTLGCVASMVL